MRTGNGEQQWTLNPYISFDIYDKMKIHNLLNGMLKRGLDEVQVSWGAAKSSTNEANQGHIHAYIHDLHT